MREVEFTMTRQKEEEQKPTNSDFILANLASCVLQRVAALQRVAVCCSVLQCVAM